MDTISGEILAYPDLLLSVLISKYIIQHWSGTHHRADSQPIDRGFVDHDPSDWRLNL